MSSNARWECDRCGESAAGEEAAVLLAGWAQVTLSSDDLADLCPDCERDCRSWLNSGPTEEEYEARTKGDEPPSIDASEAPIVGETNFLMMPLGIPETLFDEGETREIVIWPQRDFVAHRLMLPTTMASLGFVVEDITFAQGDPQLQGVPCELFNEVAMPLRLNETVLVGQSIRVRVTRQPRKAAFVGCILGEVKP